LNERGEKRRREGKRIEEKKRKEYKRREEKRRECLCISLRLLTFQLEERKYDGANLGALCNVDKALPFMLDISIHLILCNIDTITTSCSKSADHR
tara:strand:- start:581 stop:865 length:285 start_codon:yes stop_codon:yes gene_type:complete